MMDRFRVSIQVEIKTITTIGATKGVFNIELVLLEKDVPFHGAVR